jgi:hypothetical protein
MTSEVDMANRALGEMRGNLISSFTDGSEEAKYVNLFYNNVRRKLLRTAPWGFCRATVQLTPTGSVINSPPNNTYPFVAQYAYPPDCVKLRYVLPQPPPLPNQTILSTDESLFWSPWMMPSRQFRFLESFTNGTRMIQANITNAIGVYNADVQDPTLWDDLFEDAFAMALAYKLIMPLSGDVGLKSDFMNGALAAITAARAADGNEAQPTTDNTPDWIQARGYPSAPFGGVILPGQWMCTWDDYGWGS